MLSRPWLILAWLLAVPAPVAAHPHIFIDGGADFVFDGDGNLERLRVTWIYDPLYSLSNIVDFGLDVDADGVLDETEKAALAESQTAHWMEGFQGDGYLLRDDVAQALGLPENARADYIDGRAHIVFERPLLAPFRPGADTVFEAYDPTYYVQHSVTLPPALENAEGCVLELVKFQADQLSQEKLAELAQLGTYQSPDDPNIGRAFADRIIVTCD